LIVNILWIFYFEGFISFLWIKQKNMTGVPSHIVLIIRCNIGEGTIG